jgi:Ca2+-binding EF-hand superfamily protein
MFNSLDSDSNKKIDVYEFTAALPTIEKWGVKVVNVEAVFRKIDVNKSGFIIFDEFCHWAIQNSLDIEDDDYFRHSELEGMK